MTLFCVNVCARWSYTLAFVFLTTLTFLLFHSFEKQILHFPFNTKMLKPNSSNSFIKRHEQDFNFSPFYFILLHHIKCERRYPTLFKRQTTYLVKTLPNVKLNRKTDFPVVTVILANKASVCTA